MNPLIPIVFKLLPKVLPQLIPLADSLRGKRAPPPQDMAESRLHELEKTIEILADRSVYLERRMKQARALMIMTLLLSLGTLITVLVRWP
jgi:hypothetical protein